MKNELLRHCIATIAYRFSKAVKNQHESFGEFHLEQGTRSTNEIINHMYEVLHATRVSMETEQFARPEIEKLNFNGEVERFQKELSLLDGALSEKELPMNYSKRLMQGPISDLFTDIGQLSMMSRLNGTPKDWEDFSSASIETGKFTTGQ